jgi:Fe-S oxidoreductase
MIVARGMMEGLLEPSKEMAGMLERCLLCGYCQARCALKNMDVIMSMRHRMAEEGLASQIHVDNVNRIVEQGSLFDAQIRTRRDGEIPVYVGCLYRSRPKELGTVFSVLERLGIYPKVGQEHCCGYIVDAAGFPREFEQVKRRCGESIDAEKDHTLLTLCPTCTITLKEKYGLPVLHAIVAVEQRLKDPALARALRPLNLRATYHDPCHLGRMLGIFDEPREILRRLGVEVIEMEHNRYFSTCCGGGGGLRAVDDKLSIEISKNRIRDAVTAGAEKIVTVCPTCESTLLRASGRLVKEMDRFIDVQSLWDLLDQSLR